MSDLFHATFGTKSSACGYAHGRVNLMGDHTDYNGGYVLPICIPQGTSVELGLRTDGRVRVNSDRMGPDVEEFQLGSLERTGEWTDYVKGVLEVSREQIGVTGCDILIRSTVPVGSGLSSSAALEVSLLRALRAACDSPLTDVELAQLGRKAENDFVGAPVGIMDQMAASVGDENHALFLDTRTLEFEKIPIPTQLGIVVIDSGLTHSHASGAYADRKRECTEAAEMLKLLELRDIGHIDAAHALPEPQRQRAYHVVSENERVLQMGRALRDEEFEDIGGIMRESHKSLSFDFEVSTPEIDRLVEIAESEDGVYGARLTGGGFGGCIVALAQSDVASKAAAAIVERYEKATGQRSKVIVPIPTEK
jgi:galactokinase